MSATSLSSSGRIWGRGDTSVTRTPQLWKKSANSQPVAPAPTTSRWSGKAPRSTTSLRREHAIVVDLGERRIPGRCAGGDQQVVVGDLLGSAIGAHGKHAVANDRAAAVDDRCFGGIEAFAHAARLVRRHPARMRDRAQQVDARPPVLERDAAFLGLV